MSRTRSLRFVFLLVAVLVMSGCASPGEKDGFGPPEQARSVMASGEASYPPESVVERERTWREALCRAQRESREVLQTKLSDVVTDAWARERLRDGNDLPPLTQALRQQWVSELLGKSRQVGLGEVAPGRIESYRSVRLAGDFSACLREVHVQDKSPANCALPPEEAEVADCRDRESRGGPVYFLE